MKKPTRNDLDLRQATLGREVGEAVAAAAMRKVLVNYPWLAIDKPKEFGTQWISNRAACESGQELRRKEYVGQ